MHLTEFEVFTLKCTVLSWGWNHHAPKHHDFPRFMMHKISYFPPIPPTGANKLEQKLSVVPRTFKQLHSFREKNSISRMVVIIVYLKCPCKISRNPIILHRQKISRTHLYAQCSSYSFKSSGKSLWVLFKSVPRFSQCAPRRRRKWKPRSTLNGGAKPHTGTKGCLRK